MTSLTLCSRTASPAASIDARLRGDFLPYAGKAIARRHHHALLAAFKARGDKPRQKVR